MTIPASNIVSVQPGVLSAGGNSLVLNGVILSKSTLLPVSAPQSFASKDAVSAFFGPSSTEYALSQIYFSGFDTSTVKPTSLLFASYVDTSGRAAWLTGGSLAGMTLDELQALSGTIIVTVDGTQKTSSSINFATATSFSNAASMIQSAFSGSPLTCTWDSVRSVFVLTSATVGASSTMTYATGTLSASLNLTQATGAILSQGAVADTPATAMDRLRLKTQNWATFTTMWEPVLADKEAFAAWSSAQNSRYLYVAWDTDAQAIVNGSTSCFGAIAKSAAYDGTMVVSGDANATTLVTAGMTLAQGALNLAVFALGCGASIDFSRRNGRITAAFKTQSGFIATVTDEQVAANLLANGYSFYGAYATANQGFSFFYNGQLSGKWLWFDTFLDQVYLNSQFQLVLLTLLTQANSVPYNQQGYSLIRAAMNDPIQAMILFGAIRSGITLSNLQAAELNQAAGLQIDSIINQQGYYLQILDPTAQIRQARGTPVINFWFTDGGAIHKLQVSSIDVI